MFDSMPKITTDGNSAQFLRCSIQNYKNYFKVQFKFMNENSHGVAFSTMHIPNSPLMKNINVTNFMFIGVNKNYFFVKMTHFSLLLIFIQH